MMRCIAIQTFNYFNTDICHDCRKLGEKCAKHAERIMRVYSVIPTKQGDRIIRKPVGDIEMRHAYSYYDLIYNNNYVPTFGSSADPTCLIPCWFIQDGRITCDPETFSSGDRTATFMSLMQLDTLYLVKYSREFYQGLFARVTTEFERNKENAPPPAKHAKLDMTEEEAMIMECLSSLPSVMELEELPDTPASPVTDLHYRTIDQAPDHVLEELARIISN